MNKSPLKKAKLGKKMRQNRRIPLFVVGKTARKVTTNRNRRSWRSKKLHIED